MESDISPDESGVVRMWDVAGLRLSWVSRRIFMVLIDTDGDETLWQRFIKDPEGVRTADSEDRDS